jgi:hypothetical protein
MASEFVELPQMWGFTIWLNNASPLDHLVDDDRMIILRP